MWGMAVCESVGHGGVFSTVRLKLKGMAVCVQYSEVEGVRHGGVCSVQ